MTLDHDLRLVDTTGRDALVARARLLADALDGVRGDPKRGYLIPQLDRQFGDALVRLGIGTVPGIGLEQAPWDEYLREMRRVEEEERVRATAYRDATTPPPSD